MKIGIDIRPLQTASRYRGIGRVLYNILDYGKKDLDKHKLVFYAEKNLELPDLIKDFENAKINWIDSGFHKKRFIRALVSEYRPVKLSSDIDVFLQVEASLGVPKNVKSVVFFHDLIPLIFRKEELKSQNIGLLSLKRRVATNLYWRKYLKSLDAYKRASKIISISNHSQNDLYKYILNKSSNKSEVIYLSSTPVDIIEKKPDYLQKARYLLYVGGIDYRKNVVGVLEDFAKVIKSKPNLKFVFVGKEFSKKNELDDFGWSQTIEKYNLSDKIITPGFVSDEELSYLYAHAEAFVFPSRYEGFGLPVLEAMQAGCPVIAYANSSIPEVAGDAALLVDDGTSMAPTIIRILSEKGLRQKLINLGKENVKKFSWKKTAKKTIELIEKTA